MKKIILSFVLILICSCSLARPTVKPEVSIVNLQLTEATVFETTAQFTVRIDNENPFPLTFTGAVHRIYLNDIYIGKGFDDLGLTVPKLGTTTEVVKVQINNLTLLSKIQSLLQQPHLNYRIKSTLYPVDNFFLVGGMEVTQEGSFDFSPMLAGPTKTP